MSAAASPPVWAALPLPALVLDDAGLVAAVNAAAETFLNLSARSLLGRPLTARLAIDAPMDEAIARARRDQSPVFISEASLSTGERPPAHCSITLSALPEAGGGLLVLITPREMADRLGRGPGGAGASRSAIGMAEMLAHEIKNPLAGIAGAAQLLAMNLGAEDRELTDLIVEETRRIVKLLEQVERFGDQRPPQRRAVNLHDALDRARRSALVGFAAGMRITEDYDPSLPLTHADPDQLMQVFLNLIKNAAEAAGPAGGTIRLRSYYDFTLRRRFRDGTSAALPLQVEVIDDGPGVPAELQQSVFEPFVSGKENGTGLGLALVAKIIADHQGWISLDSQPGRTVFRISLPLAPRAALDSEN
ncbi:MAG: two-component system sensor histidine kinase NtrB [Paracoccaceae bacterium]